MINIFIAASAYAFFQVVSSFGAKKLSDIWFTISGAISILISTFILFLYYRSKTPNIGNLNLSGFLTVFVANIGITVFTFYLGKSFQSFPSEFVIPLLFGGAIAISTIASFAIHSQVPTLTQLISLCMIVGGLVLFAFGRK